MPIDFNDLEDHIGEDGKFNPPTKAENPQYAKKRFECVSCSGTGRWRGGVNNRGNGKCNTCHGKGFLVTSPEARSKAKQSRQDVKRRNMKANMELEVYKRVNDMAEWNGFAASLVEQHRSGKLWSVNQVAAVERMIAKVDATRAAKAKAYENAPTVDMSPIMDMFEAAIESGYKKPTYRAEGVYLKLATGANTGGLYVLNDEKEEPGRFGMQRVYEGKILNNRFHATRNTSDNILPALLAIAADPHGAAVRYGRRTGSCACCGRQLTKVDSIERGIGPVCADRWGLATG